MMRVVGLAAFFVIAFFGCATAAENTTIFVVDSTAQMSTKIGANTRLDLLRQLVPAAVKRMAPSSAASLVVFGNDPAKKCESFAELVAPGEPSKAGPAFADQMQSLTPRAGRSPIAPALRAALKSAGEGKEAKSTIVLISGSGDDCGGDICASARALQVVYPAAKLVVFGLGTAPPVTDALTCAAKAMDGTFTPVKNAGDLDRGLKQLFPALPPQADKLPKAAPAPESKPSPQPKKAEVQAANEPAPEAEPNEQAAEQQTPPPSPPVEPNVILTAVLSSDAPALNQGVTWQITKLVSTPTGQIRLADKPSWVGGGGIAKLNLGDGNYIARATYGLATATMEFQASGAGKVERSLSLEAGTIGAEALQKTGGPPASNVLFILTREKAGSPPEEVARSTQKLALFTVNAGTYKLSVQASGSKVESSVNVLPGKISAVSMSLNLGNLDIKAVAAEGQQVPIPAWFQLYPAAGAKAAAFTISAASSQVQLPAGAYRVVAHYGQAMREDTVSIAPGETTTKTIVMDAGEAQLHIAAKAAAGIMPVCDVFSESAGGAPIARLAGTNASFIGRAGQYELRCHGKDAAQIIASKHIRIGAGETVMEEVTN